MSMLLCITDLEVDQMDPFVATANINRWILPEFVLQAVLSLLLLLTGHWILFLLAVPLTCYHAMLFIRRQHLIDVTEVFRNLNTDKKRRMIKLGVYMIFFAIFIFRLFIPFGYRIGTGILVLFNCKELDICSSFFKIAIDHTSAPSFSCTVTHVLYIMNKAVPFVKNRSKIFAYYCEFHMDSVGGLFFCEGVGLPLHEYIDCSPFVVVVGVRCLRIREANLESVFEVTGFNPRSGRRALFLIRVSDGIRPSPGLGCCD
ncbi:hypothetical protein SADUNF_Sadunf06G0041100 [Salix dunnii]|uniref:Uncharacterized protein n=1 Tax=Salix dunnii TaxID=1413687 RepID=A0A835K792_9ROSI|nr:hypothetical protein SADUNF_Sadunf06G0041100 [Salix dunnii]